MSWHRIGCCRRSAASTSPESICSQPQSLDDAESLHGFYRILRAGRTKTAADPSSELRTNLVLVKASHGDVSMGRGLLGRRTLRVSQNDNAEQSEG